VCADVGNDTHAFGLDTEGDDFAGEFVRTGLLEGTDGRHFKSPFSGFEPAPLRPRWRSTGRRRSLAHPRLRGLDSTGGTFLLARGMTRLGVPWNMGCGRQGKKVMTTLLHQSDRSAP